VAPIDGKAVAAIEKLTGQTLAWAGEPPAGPQERQPRDHQRQPREHARPRREQAPRTQDGAGQRPSREPAPQRRPDPLPAKVARFGDTAARRPVRQAEAEDEHSSHLPAFLLRPLTVKA
jgi:hypothetical protein